jgi:putative inorganic carbon (HCO3(-)) transporter
MYLIALIIPILVSLFLTQSRNVYLGVLISLIIYGIFVNWRFLVSYILFMCLIWIVMPDPAKDRVRSIFDLNHPSNKSRIVMWDVGIKVYKDYPLLGVGDNEITKVYTLYKTPESHGEGSHFHSNPVMILATTGTIGALFYILIWVSIFLYALNDYRRSINNFDKELIIGIIIAMISFHISGIFEWNFGDWEVVTLLYYLISFIFVLKLININHINKNGKE